MGKVYGAHLIRLKPSASEEAFEKAVAEALPEFPLPEGWRMLLLKGERGDRAGKYLLLFEIESLEARNRYTPTPETYTEEWEAFKEANRESWDRFGRVWEHFSSNQPGENTIFTDYVTIAES